MPVKLERKVALALAKELKAITTEANLDALAVITGTGDKVAFFSAAEVDSAELCAVGAAITSTVRFALEKWGFDPIEDVALRGKNGFLILRALSDEFSLLGGTENLQQAQTASTVLAKHASKVLDILSHVTLDE